MKKITDSYLEKHLKGAVAQIVPDRSEQIWEKPVEKAKGNEWFLDGTSSHRQNNGRMIKIFSAIAACFAVCFLSYYMLGFRTDAAVYLDVNPAIELEINYRGKVLHAEAKNPEGESVLGTMDLKHTDLNTAVNALLGSMVRQGYLSETKNTVLLSVDCSSRKRGDLLRKQLSDEITTSLEALIGCGQLFEQEIEADEELDKLADFYGITAGKAALLKKLEEEHPHLEYSKLAGLSMNELIVYLEQAGIHLRDYVEYTETEDGDDPEEDEKQEMSGEKDSDAGKAPDFEGNIPDGEADDTEADDTETEDTETDNIETDNIEADDTEADDTEGEDSETDDLETDDTENGDAES